MFLPLFELAGAGTSKPLSIGSFEGSENTSNRQTLI